MNATKPVSLNMNVRGLGTSATLSIKQRVNQLRRDGREVYDFGLGQSPFPVPEPVVEALREAAPQKDYLAVAGLPALREAVSEFHRTREGLDAQANRIIVGPGSKELMFILQLVYYGEILLPTPCWVSYLPQARIIGRRVSLIKTSRAERWKVSPERLQQTIEVVQDDLRPRLLILNYPSNPTGLGYSDSELKEMAEVARRYQIIVLSDEIYGQLNHTGQHTSIAKYYPEGTIIASGLSKWCGAGGWRLGTFLFPPELDWLCDTMSAVASETYTSVSAPIQHAAVTAFKCGPEIETYLHHARRILAMLGKRCAETLDGTGIHVYAPEGGFYLFLDFGDLRPALEAKGITKGSELCNRLVEETGAAVLPGSAFARSRSELTARLAYVDFDGGDAMRASMEAPLDEPLPKGFAEKWCERVVRGMERIAEWGRKVNSK